MRSPKKLFCCTFEIIENLSIGPNPFARELKFSTSLLKLFDVLHCFQYLISEFSRWSSLEAHDKQKDYCCHAFVIRTLLSFLSQRYSTSTQVWWFFLYPFINWWFLLLISCKCLGYPVALPFFCRRGSWGWLYVAFIRGRGMQLIHQ